VELSTYPLPRAGPGNSGWRHRGRSRKRRRGVEPARLTQEVREIVEELVAWWSRGLCSLQEGGDRVKDEEGE